jgi:hypothetical protein
VIAAGAVPLALSAFLIDLRMTQWSLGTRFVAVAAITGLLLGVAWLAELEYEAPRAYHSVLLLSGLIPLVLVLVLLAELLGSSRPPGAGGITWIFAVEAAVAMAAARRANSAVCTLIAAVAAGVAVEGFVEWVFAPHGGGTFRAILLVLTVAYAVAAVRLRDRRRRHAVALVNAGGLTALVLGATYVFAFGYGLLRVSGAPFGWVLYLLAAGFGLVAYASVDREPGPGYLGTAVLLEFVFLAGVPAPERGSLVGWPLFLLVIGAAGVALGLRPRKPLPPPPDANISQAAPPVPLHRDHTQ